MSELTKDEWEAIEIGIMARMEYLQCLRHDGPSEEENNIIELNRKLLNKVAKIKNGITW